MDNADAKLPDVAERRGVPRRRVPYRMDVSDSTGGPVGYVVDLTSDGMRVRFRPGLDVGSLERLQIHVPRWMELGDALLVRGRFLWCKPFGIGTLEGGFHFEDLGRPGLRSVEALIGTIERAIAEDWDSDSERRKASEG